ncbi:hypothetical protein DICVIV_07590 [Dictyocaulus viviparus]|uniref:Elongator complex protein 4 n=1 Tax=Dictyocaulus viviparus TaxID=29172 RepID=A0A0D8XNZ1_DICVI|nr:hypothetical protein DICVIV_07590 [Dictyocaulus viviparus]
MNDIVCLEGCTLKGRSLETSSGCSALDTLLGGGLPVTSFCIVDELKSRTYSTSIVKYFLAEGLYSGHDILLIDPLGGDKLLKEIPTKYVTEPTISSTAQRISYCEDDLSIAFRYATRPKVNSSIGGKNRYDLSKSLDIDIFSSQILRFDGPLCYESLYHYVTSLCKNSRYKGTCSSTKKLLRIVINHLGSPIWKDTDNFSPFLVRTRSILRSANVVLLGTASSETMFKRHSDELYVTADLYLQLVAFSEEEEKTFLGSEKYHGFLRILRLPRLTSLCTYNPPVDLVFTQKRNSFDVSVMHLPPIFNDDKSTKKPCEVDF